MNPITELPETRMVDGAQVDDRSRELAGPPIDRRLIEHARPKKSVMRRLVKALMLVAVLIGGGFFALYKMRVNIPALNTPRIYASLDSLGARAEQIKGRVVSKYDSYFHKHEAEAHHEPHRLTVTSPMKKDLTITQEYVCQIHSRRHIDVCALEDGYLKAIPVKEGQAVKQGELMFEVVPTLYKARWDAEVAELQVSRMKFEFGKSLADKKGISQNEVKLLEAELAKAQAKADLAKAEYDFASVKAAFDGIMDRLKVQEGSLVSKGDLLTTLSDNNVMWVYFNVTEKRYLEYMAEVGQNRDSPDIELVLANHSKFPHTGMFDPIRRQIGAIEANFNNETGNIAFRADFPNPERLLRHGQTGTVLVNRALKDALVIPQRATFENLAKRYVYVVDKDELVHQREIEIQYELDDVYVIEKGIVEGDRILLEGIRQVREGEKVEYEFRRPEEIIGNQKNKAE